MEINEFYNIVKDNNVFLTGGGGVGKSYLIKELGYRLPLVVTSSTGISAVNIGGQTIHSWAGIGIANTTVDYVVSKIKRNKAKRKEIEMARYLVIDEISMLNAYVFDYIDLVLKEVRGDGSPFGGLRVILVGDFYQLPPVKLGETEELNNAKRFIDYAFNSKAWKELNLKTIHLTEVYRQTDKTFVDTLNRIRVGECLPKDTELLSKRAFPSGFEPPKEVVKLYSVNELVDAENEKRYSELDGEEHIYKASDFVRSYIDKEYKMVRPTNSNLPEWDRKRWENFNRDCRIPQTLKLKVGARVMLLFNKDFGQGLVNGSCGYVEKLDDNSVKVNFDNGESHWVKSEIWEIHNGTTVTLSREQIPLRLAYSASIHKAQGQTYDKVFIDFNRIFAAGQAYVALSRVRSLEGLYMVGFNPNKVFADERVKEFYEGLR